MALKFQGNIKEPVRKGKVENLESVEKDSIKKTISPKRPSTKVSHKPIEEKEIKKSTNKKPLLIIAGVILVIGVFSISKIIGSNNAKKVKEELAQQQQQKKDDITVTDTNGSKTDLQPTDVPGVFTSNTKPDNISSPDKDSDRKENVIPGSPNLKADNNMVNGAPIESKVKLVQDMKGSPIDVNWQIASIANVTDFINYEKKRSIMSTGMELFWLECTYKDGRPYRVTVPFSIFKELEPKGITVANVEVAVLKDGQSVVTYMSVNPEYKQLITDKKKAEELKQELEGN